MKETDKMNAVMMNAASELVLNDPRCIKKEFVDEFMRMFQMSEKQAVLELMAAYLGFDFEEHPEQRSLFHHYFEKDFQIMSSSLIEQDAYLKKLHHRKIHSGQFQMEWMRFEPYELMFIDDIKMDCQSIQRIAMGCFSQQVEYPILFENGIEWMSIVPSEVHTMRPCIEKMHGKVLVLGLGMGYFAYHVSEKNDVVSIDIVEVSKDAINLFSHDLLSVFEHKEKIQLIQMDAMQALETLDLNCYDCVFADIWHNGLDGAEWVKQFEPVLQQYPHLTWINWLQNSIDAILLEDEASSQ
ncbi:MAG: hypothetical protein IJ356_05155 [Erysipelotrichaceae bacterium]|nr:hypothetical protein [Erysipelotrichaceae bacterium]